MILLCANKCEVDPSSWTVSREEIQTFASTHSLEVCEASALSGDGVSDMFYKLSRQILVTSKSELKEMKNSESLVLFENQDGAGGHGKKGGKRGTGGGKRSWC